MPVLYTRNKPHKKKPNWKNILLTAFCLVLVVCSVTLLIKAVPSWNSGTQMNKSSASPAPSKAAETPVPSESPSPTETPAPSESVEPSAEPTPARGSGVQSITFGAVGSIMMHAHELQAAKTGNSYDFGSFFARVQPYLSWQDVTLGTLETTIASDKFDETRAPAQLLTAMKNNGFDLVSLASAQILDSDIAGAQATVQAAKEAELLSTGAYASGSDYVKPLIIEKDDLRIAVLSYTEKTDKLPDGATDTVKYLTEATFDNDLKQIRADETGIDFIIVCVQWSGDSAELTDSQKAWAQTFADNDVDVVLGTCAHRQQSLTYVQGKDGNRTLVAYSLGSFLDAYRNNGRDAAVILNFKLTKDFDKDEKNVGEVTYTPIWELKYSSEGKYAFEMMNSIEYSSKKYQNMSLADRDRIKLIRKEIETAMGTGAGQTDINIRTMTDGVSTIVEPAA